MTCGPNGCFTERRWCRCGRSDRPQPRVQSHASMGAGPETRESQKHDRKHGGDSDLSGSLTTQAGGSAAGPTTEDDPVIPTIYTAKIHGTNVRFFPPQT